MPVVWLDFSDNIAAPERSIVLHSCEVGLGVGTCQTTPMSASQASTPATAPRASVTELQELAYQVEVRASDGSLRVRHIEFSARDPAAQRFEAIGLVVSSLVRSSEAEPAARAPVANHRAPAIVPARPQPARRSGRLSVDAGLALGTGLASGVDRYGFFLRANYAPWQQGFEFGGSLRHQFRVGEPEARWQSVGVGGGYAGGSLLRPEVRAELVLERLAVSAERSGVTQSSTLLRVGGRASLGIALELGSWLELVAGGTCQYLRPKVSVGISGVDAGTLPALGGEGFLGLGGRWQ